MKRTLFGLTILLSIFLNLQNIPARFNYGWDQRRDAKVLEELVDGHKLTLVGPRVVSDTGFFLGPMHYYLLVPFYLAAHDTQLAEIYLACVVSVLTCVSTLYVGSNLFGARTAVMAGLLAAVMPATVSWNPMYLPGLALVVLLCCNEIIRQNYRYIFLASVAIAIGLQAHFTAVFLAGYVVVAIALARPSKRVVKYILMGVGVIGVSFLPLLFFDLRHNFVNLNSFINFFMGGNGHFGLNSDVVRVFLRSQNVVMLTAAFVGMFMKPYKLMAMLVIWVMVPVVAFLFYRGGISEYYFSIVTPVVILMGVSTTFGILKRFN
jgi:hypothetical protein